MKSGDGGAPGGSGLRVLYYLAAFGAPSIEIKTKVLLNNLAKLAAQAGAISRLDVALNTYGPSTGALVPALVNQIRGVLPPSSAVLLHHEDKAMLAELWKSNPHHHRLEERYDRIVFILDDVLLVLFDVAEVDCLFTGLSLDIFTPLVHNATRGPRHCYMYELAPGVPQPQVKLLNSAEMFCYFLRPATFLEMVRNRYDAECPCIWGADLLLGHWGYRTALSSGARAIHLIKNSSGQNVQDNWRQLRLFMAKNGFQPWDRVFQEYEAVIWVKTVAGALQWGAQHRR